MLKEYHKIQMPNTARLFPGGPPRIFRDVKQVENPGGFRKIENLNCKLTVWPGLTSGPEPSVYAALTPKPVLLVRNGISTRASNPPPSALANSSRKFFPYRCPNRERVLDNPMPS
jgi:hypothetical protein